MYLAQIIHDRLFIARRMRGSRSQNCVAKKLFRLRIRRITITQTKMMYGFQCVHN